MSAIAAIALSMAPAAAPPCALPPGWRQVEARDPRYVIFGEIHGTAQAPAIVGSIACALAKRHGRVLLAIEQSSTDNAAFQSVWRSADTGFEDRLKESPGWAGRSDGVASEAMLALLVRLHAQRSAGGRIAVILFNGPRDEAQAKRFAYLSGQGPHEAAQAENIRDAASHGQFDIVLVLCGSAHALKHNIEREGATYSPMAMQLAPAVRIVSLRIVSGAGTMWNCSLKPGFTPMPGKPVRPEAVDCGNHPTRAMASFDAKPFVAFGDPPGAEGGGNYDGYIWVGPVTGSPPAVATAPTQ